VARAAGGADDAASPGPMRRRTAAGGTTALSDAMKYSGRSFGFAIEQASREFLDKT
jgi:hypothetical protein